MNFPSKIFLDGGDPEETKQADALLKAAGHVGIQGQTTNPSLIIKNLKAKFPGKALTEEEKLAEYKRIVIEMAKVTSGPISIQVIANEQAMTDDMLTQARERITWIPNGVIKFPCTKEGLAAAEDFSQEGPVNMTLTFTQSQAAAVYAATRKHAKEVYVSPFVGRLDDRGEKGMDVVANIIQMYKAFGDGHVQVLTASVRTVKQIQYALWLKSDVITIPFKLLQEWSLAGFPLPSSDFLYDVPGLTEIPYRELSLDDAWTAYDLSHDLTSSGITKFWQDWIS